MLTGHSKRVGSNSYAAVALATESLEELSDEGLLDRFLGQDDATAEAAFRAIVVRHGPMVLGVCRHVLNQLQDAEDAFQATFLVLARKGGSIRDRRVLARWLHEVACRIAMRSRTVGVRRRLHERQGGEMAATVTSENSGWSELKPIIHEEVNHLPEKYRLPVILSYLEGKTNEEVARLLDWPVGTVKGRLSRARDLLRSRLTRRGLALSAAFLFTALSDGAVFAEVVPPRLLDDTVARALVIAPRAGGMGQAGEDATGDAWDVDVVPHAVGRLMALAVADPWNSRRLVVAGLLLLTIAGVLASLGFSYSFLFNRQPGGGVLLHPFGRMASDLARTANSIQIPFPPQFPVPQSSCHSSQAPSLGAH
jgi:RNA polymerase sigma factor (sigma-70 family)